MFEKAIASYYRLLRGNGPFASIFFHTTAGFVFASIIFCLININTNNVTVLIIKYEIPINYNTFLLFPAEKVKLTAPLSYGFKVLEYLVLIFFSILFTSIADYLLRKAYLKDALTPIRKKMLGQWDLELFDFAGALGEQRDFSCKVWFSNTEANKLRAFYYQANELELDGNSALISLSVSGSGQNPSQIDLSFAIEGYVSYGGAPQPILYWAKLNHTSYINNQKSYEFKGPWFRCMGIPGEYSKSGTAKLTFDKKTRN